MARCSAGFVSLKASCCDTVNCSAISRGVSTLLVPLNHFKRGSLSGTCHLGRLDKPSENEEQDLSRTLLEENLKDPELNFHDVATYRRLPFDASRSYSSRGVRQFS